jgi:leucine-rich repeat protein SHOC2
MNPKSFMYFTCAFVFGLTYRVFNSEPQPSTTHVTKDVSPNFLASLPPLPPKVAHSVAALDLSVTHLDLTNQNLSTLSIEIFKHKQLKTITLKGNHLENLPKEIGALTDLEELHLQGNRLKSLPVEIGELTQLKVLNLNENQLKQLPIELYKLSGLHTLYLKNNELKKLSTEIGNLTGLWNLDLDGNQLKTLPAELCKLMLSERNISKNPFESLPKCIRYN